jgi:hypothetical protein
MLSPSKVQHSAGAIRRGFQQEEISLSAWSRSGKENGKTTKEALVVVPIFDVRREKGTPESCMKGKEGIDKSQGKFLPEYPQKYLSGTGWVCTKSSVSHYLLAMASIDKPQVKPAANKKDKQKEVKPTTDEQFEFKRSSARVDVFMPLDHPKCLFE